MQLEAVLMDMLGYEAVQITDLMPGYRGGISVRFTVSFTGNTSVTVATITSHLKNRVDENGQLIGTAFMVTTRTKRELMV